MMKDADDWDFIFNYTDALFYRLAVGITSRADMSLADCHEALWTAFENGCFRLRDGDEDSVGEVGVVPCHSDDDQCAAMEQNQPLVNYRRHLIEEAGIVAACRGHTATFFARPSPGADLAVAAASH
jgi:hypothetical protein